MNAEGLEDDVWGVAGIVAVTISAFLCLVLVGCGSGRPFPVVPPLPAVASAASPARLALPVASVFVPASPAVALSWSYEAGPELFPYVQVWASTNLQAWALKTNVAGNTVVLPATLAREFFKVRGAYTVTGHEFFTDWARR